VKPDQSFTYKHNRSETAVGEDASGRFWDSSTFVPAAVSEPPPLLPASVPALSHLADVLLGTGTSLGPDWARSCRKGPRSPFLVLGSPAASCSSRLLPRSSRQHPRHPQTHLPPSGDSRRQGLTCYQRLRLVSTPEGQKRLKLVLSSSVMIVRPLRHPL